MSKVLECIKSILFFIPNKIKELLMFLFVKQDGNTTKLAMGHLILFTFLFCIWFAVLTNGIDNWCEVVVYCVMMFLCFLIYKTLGTKMTTEGFFDKLINLCVKVAEIKINKQNNTHS